MGSVTNNTDNLGTPIYVGDHVGYIYGAKDSCRIHSGIIVKLCEKSTWIKPDEDFETDARVNADYEDIYRKFHPYKKVSKYDRYYLAPYGRIVKLPE